MGSCRKWCTLVLAILAAVLGYASYGLFEVPEVPQLDQNQWWGPGLPVQQDTTIRLVKVEFEPERIAHLKQRLNETSWFTEPLEDVAFQYGFNGKYLKEVVDFWRDEYDFVEREKYINEYFQYKVNIQGLEIHFVHIIQRARGIRIMPMLLLHGWPGSFVEFHKMIPLLARSNPNRDFVFNLVIPSLPGYGYSQASSKPGLGAAQMAVIMRNLMNRLGYGTYVVQGGDWGALITNAMAIMYPEEIYGYHTNMAFVQTGLGTTKALIGSLYPPMFMEKQHVPLVYPLSKVYSNLLQETGYMHIQSTKPDTVGIALMDSPVGLAAYILEKFSTWTNKEWRDLPDGGLTKKYNLTELLDNIMIYWDSRSITTSMRLYAETFNKAHLSLGIEKIPVSVPTAVARLPHEITFTTRWQMREKYLNLVQVTDFPTGGHFAAFEEPQLLADDIISAMKAFDRFHEANHTEFGPPGPQ